MPALNFQKQFAPDVQSGLKTQTIRAVRKNPIKKGDTLYLYTGMRTKVCRKLGEAECTGVLRVRISRDWIQIGSIYYTLTSELDGQARRDGFDSWEQMRDWFDETHGLPFAGVLIEWEKVK